MLGCERAGRAAQGSAQAPPLPSLLKWGAKGKAGSPGTGADAPLLACLKLGNFFLSLGQPSSAGEEAEGSWGGRRRAVNADLRPTPGRDSGGAQAGVRAAAGCAPCPPGALPPPSPGSCVAPPLPPTCFLPQPPAPI